MDTYLGARKPIIRLDLEWWYVQDCPACASRWDKLDPIVDAAHERGMRVLIILDYGAPRANGGRGDDGKWFPAEYGDTFDAVDLEEGVRMWRALDYTGPLFLYSYRDSQSCAPASGDPECHFLIDATGHPRSYGWDRIERTPSRRSMLRRPPGRAPQPTQHHDGPSTTTNPAPRPTRHHDQPSTTTNPAPRPTRHHDQPSATTNPAPRPTRHHDRRHDNAGPGDTKVGTAPWPFPLVMCRRQAARSGLRVVSSRR
jgi:hypothetical protein